MGMISIGTMVKTIAGLAGTDDVTEWESEFIESVVERTDNGRDTTKLSTKQVNIIERIHSKHFGD